MTIPKEDRTFYIGFNTIGRTRPPYSLINIELVKQDLLNAFNTRKGERVMMPEFGTRIYDLLFDPFDDITKQAILDDAVEVIRQEPRVELISIDAEDLNYTMRLTIDLIYQPQDVAEQLYVDFTRSSIEER